MLIKWNSSIWKVCKKFIQIWVNGFDISIRSTHINATFIGAKYIYIYIWKWKRAVNERTFCSEQDWMLRVKERHNHLSQKSNTCKPMSVFHVKLFLTLLRISTTICSVVIFCVCCVYVWFCFVLFLFSFSLNMNATH